VYGVPTNPAKPPSRRLRNARQPKNSITNSHALFGPMAPQAYQLHHLLLGSRRGRAQPRATLRLRAKRPNGEPLALSHPDSGANSIWLNLLY
jgi:hypothetical protein